MPVIWILADDPVSPETLRPHLEGLARVQAGTPALGEWRAAPAPDLLIWVGAAAAGDDAATPERDLERWLGFLRALARTSREAPPGLLYLEPFEPALPFALLRSLVDDRALSRLDWPPQPEELVSAAARSLGGRGAVRSLRDRARREWVSGEVERLYADLDLPALRHAIDPRNAARPVLLLGEPGTRRGLLAQYIHDLAEPAREALVVMKVSSLMPGAVERSVLEATAGRNASVLLQELDELRDGQAEELGHLLGSSGLLGVPSLRWLASARPRGLSRALRELPWLRVELPSLRRRADLPRLARSLTSERARVEGRQLALDEAALARLAAYAWPGNLRELEGVIERSVHAAPDGPLDASGLRFAPDRRELGERTPAQGAALTEAPPLEESERPEVVPPLARAEPAHPGESAPRDAPEAAVPERRSRDIAGSPAPSRGLDTALLTTIARELRSPLLALRTQMQLVAQQPTGSALRAEIGATVEGEFAELERSLRRLEAYASFGAPRPEPVDVAACARDELDQRQRILHKRSIVLLRELDTDAPRAMADPEQLRFAVGALLDCALRMVPEGGDLYVASRRRVSQGAEPASHRLMIRFHSPEEVLGGPEDVPGTATHLEIVLAQRLIERMSGEFAADTSGSQDNVILIQLPV